MRALSTSRLPAVSERPSAGVTLALLATVLVTACSSPGSAVAAAGSDRTELKIATWNLEWLITPAALRALVPTCVSEGAARPRGRYIPCDVARDLARTQEDFAALASYARKLDADVVAIQEVDGDAAARLVFPGYRFCFTQRRAVQNNGFAIRSGIPFRCGPDVRDIALDGSVRRGAYVTLYPGTRRELHLLGVHLKSGCGNRALDDPDTDCQILARQVPALERWIDTQAAAARRFAVLGDFNRNLQGDRPPARNDAGTLRALWPEIDDAEPPGSDLVNTADGEKFLNCSAQQAFSSYIDYIVLGQALAERRIGGSFQRITYSARDAARRKLSDHCPVAVRVKLS